jgi:hypothetical protein
VTSSRRDDRLAAARRAGTLATRSDGEPVFTSPLHDERTAAILGVALGVGFVVCFATGVLSHLVQDPPSWFHWPPRPAGLYRVTQGVHVVTGLALIPLLLAKLWTVYPKLFAWPFATSPARAIERLYLLPLVGGALFLLISGLGNINLWRPWGLPFRPFHYTAAWITIGALAVHVGGRWAVTRSSLRRSEAPSRAATPDRLSRRQFIGGVGAASAAVALFTVGQSVESLRRLALLTPRRPDVGPQGFPVNRTARSVRLEDVDVASWRLRVDGPGATSPVELSYDDLTAMTQVEATLPIACVEGWSTSQRWRGVRVRDLLAAAGAPAGATATVVSMQRSPRQRTSELSTDQIADPQTLIALTVNGEVLAADHGFPARLIGPNRPGVQQTKWVDHIEVHP